MTNEVVYRPKAIGPMVVDAHPTNHPSNLGGPLQAITQYAANAPRGIYTKLSVWRENTGAQLITSKTYIIMAKGIEMNGQLRGKRGGVVYYRSMGEQMSRAKNSSPRNPKSIGQAVQRMVFATASAARAALAGIVNHSFEGIAYGNKSLAFFQQEAIKMLKAQLNDPESVRQFVIKGAGVITPNPFLVSKGSLAIPNYMAAESDSGDNAAVKFTCDVDITDSPESAEGYVAMLAAMGFAPGDQLTIISLYQNDDDIVASTEDAKNVMSYVNVARIVFKPVAEIADFSPSLVSSADSRFSDNYVTRLEGEIEVDYVGSQALLAAIGAGYRPVGAAMIRSQFANGSWKRSKSELKLMSFGNFAPAGYVYETYTADAVVNYGSPYFLNNATGGAAHVGYFPRPSVGIRLAYKLDGEYINVGNGEQVEAGVAGDWELKFVGAPNADILSKIKLIVGSGVINIQWAWNAADSAYIGSAQIPAGPAKVTFDGAAVLTFTVSE